MRARSFGFVFQDAALDAHRSVLDNITESALYSGLERTEAQRRARELVEQFDVRVPLHRRPGQISGGQAQRIALCRGLLNRPPIVLADEPTGNLDPASANVVLDALAEHARGGALVIIVTHDNLVRQRADLIVDLASQPTVTE